MVYLVGGLKHCVASFEYVCCVGGGEGGMASGMNRAV